MFSEKLLQLLYEQCFNFILIRLIDIIHKSLTMNASIGNTSVGEIVGE